MNPHDDGSFIADPLQMDINTEDDSANNFEKGGEEIGSIAQFNDVNDADALDAFTLFSKLDLSIDKSAVSHEEGGVEGNCELAYSGQSSTIYRLDDLENKSGGCTGFLAIKTPAEEFPNDDGVSRLNNEYNILKHLSNCVAVRNAIRLKSEDEATFLFLEWVPGIPLRKFVTDVDHDPTRILDVARVVTKAIADVHDAGVVHSNISLDNIIIDDQNNDLHASVKIIDFASASFLPEGDNHASVAVRNDLISLGVLFFEMFSGQSPFQQEDSLADFEVLDFGDTNDMSARTNDEKRRNAVDRTFISQGAIYSKLSAAIPVCLVKLILILMEFQGTNQNYQSARAVEQDLSSFRDPVVFVSNSQYDKNFGQLQINPDKLYDQAQNISLLMQICKRIVSEPCPEMVLISGRSGTGKSSIVNQVKKTLSAKGEVAFISGKFDQLKQVEPFAAILSAFSRYFTELSQKGEETVSNTRNAILEAVGSDLAFLVQTIPTLLYITGKPKTNTIQHGGMEAENYFNFIFGKLIRAIATPTHPIVLHLDDLHWADPSSLKLIKTLVTDTNSTSFLFVGCCRDDEVNIDHPLACLLSSIEKTVPITMIKSANISKDSTNEMVSGILHMPPSSTKPLADLVYRKTGGNGLIVSQFLQTLWYEGSLQFLLESNTWTWNVNVIESKGIPDDAVGLLVEKMLHLPHVARYILQCFSCLGSSCHESTVRLIIDQEAATQGTENRPLMVLNMIIGEGLLNKEGSEYKFAHDQIQLAAYSLIPSDKRGCVHLHIGSMILKHAPECELENVLFIAADQLNRGSNFIECEEKKVELAKLNLRAGEKAMSLGTFFSAVAYLQAGIEMLGANSWDKHYRLSLQLHSSHAESLYSIGDFTKVGEATGQTIMHAKSIVDKLCAYITLIKAVAAQKKAQEAIKIGLEILEDLGEPISTSNTTKEELMGPLFQAKGQFEGMTDEQFVGLKQMDDADKIAAMSVLDELSIHTIFTNTYDLLIAVVTKMMQLSLTNGICEETSTAFSSYAFLMVDFDSKGAYRIGNLALSIVERLKTEKNLARVYSAVYGGAHHHFERIDSSIDRHMEAYQIGMRVGDITYTIINGYIYCGKSFLCGRELTSLKEDCELIIEQATKYKQETRKTLLLVLLPSLARLIGQSDGHLDVEIIISNSDAATAGVYYFFCAWVAYIYGDYDAAAEMAEKKREAEKNLKRKFTAFSTLYFYEGLIFLALARKTKQEIWIDHAQESISNVRNQAQIAQEHFQHRLLFLEAETACVMGDVEKAKEKYDLAVNAVSEYGYINEQAIACERAGDFFLSQNDKLAAQYYVKAQTLYGYWGAQGKADHLYRNSFF